MSTKIFDVHKNHNAHSSFDEEFLLFSKLQNLALSCLCQQRLIVVKKLIKKVICYSMSTCHINSGGTGHIGTERDIEQDVAFISDQDK